MKKFIVQYSIVQFMPYPDREEKVNIGMVSYCLQNARFCFKLLKNTKTARVNHFFEKLPNDLFNLTIKLINKELNRLEDMSHQEKMNGSLFEELIRPRESLVRYSDIRVIMTNDYSACLNELFDDLVDFKSKTYNKDHDNFLNQKFKNILQQHRLDKNFKEANLGKNAIGLSVKMPFFNDLNEQSIKPLSFVEQKSEKSLLKHAANWATNIELLEQAELLNPKSHLVTYESPNNKFEAAFDFALERLEKVDVNLASIDDKTKINQFLGLH